MTGKKVEIKLLPVSDKLTKGGKYRAIIPEQKVIGYDELLKEVVESRHLPMDPALLKLAISATLDTMIAGVARDGVPRRLGDYFLLSLTVHGGFDGQGDDFDPDRHSLALNMRPLKALRHKFGYKDVSVWNRNAGPQVKILGMHSACNAAGDGLVFGEDIVIEGENLFVCDEGDRYDVKYYSKSGGHSFAGGGSIDAEWVSEDGRKVTMPWSQVLAPFVEINKLDIAEDEPIAIMVGVRTRGGEATAKHQLHRAREFFVGWKERYPDYNVKNMRWGRI